MKGSGRILAAAVIGFVTASAPAPRHPEPAPRRHLVEISGMKFSPSVLEARRGDTVVWINRDLVPHTATGVKDGTWDTGTILGNDSTSVVLRQDGELEYLCRLHPVMTAKIIVRLQETSQ
jgi:plastocyanin